MNTQDISLSSSSKMAPWPEHHQEPVAPDKTDENRVGTADTSTEAATINEANTVVTVTTETSEINSNSTVQSVPGNSGSENKQEEPATLSTLNEGELRALLDEAITYKCPKDREGKSNLFKELLQEAEADETEEGHRAVANSRCLPGSNRRRNKRDSVSERLTHGGSLQNLAQPISSEFDSSFTYLTSGCSHIYGGGRRKGKKHTGPSVSARQREGGSLPSNVNASHSLASLANLDILFDKKGFADKRTSYDWANKEKSKSLDKPSYSGLKREDKDKERKENKRELDIGQAADGDRESKDNKRGGRGKQITNEMVESDPPPPEPKPDYMVIDLSDVEVGGIGEHNAAGAGGGTQRPHAIEAEDDEGTEMKVIEPRLPVQFITHATFDIGQTPVDSSIEFPIRENNGKQDKSKVTVNGTEATSARQFQTYNTVKCIVGGTSGGTNSQQGKVPVSNVYSMMPVNWSTTSPNLAMETVSRLATHHIPVKESSGSGEKKAFDENGNAVQGYANERKKSRRKHAQEPNVIVYKAETIEGHRNMDIDSLINFIESKESKGKKGKTTNTVRVKASSGPKPRPREKDAKREQLPAKLQKSNSLEEISKTKLEDLTAEKSISSSGASSISSQHGTTNVALRRAKQRSIGDTPVDCRGDRRSWGTEEGQSIYCNDTGDDYTTRRNSIKKINPEPEPEPDFLVVTKKKKSKKQRRRSSSGGRAQNLTTTASYLQRSRGFNNEYRTPLSPELRRKSASSMPPSDKSDSSDLDSVHSLPVTSNTTKHNLTKNTNSSGGTPQASYADIARTATINISTSSVLKMTEIGPVMLNAACWPSVPSKTPSESDKIPQDYYPSLDELQHSDRKIRQHNFANSNHVHSLSLSFDKPPSPVLSKVKSSPDNKKAEAHEEAINKNIQVFKYVRDIEKMHQRLAQETKIMNLNNSNPNSTETTTQTNQTPPKLNNSIINYYSPDSDNFTSPENTNLKDANLNSRINIPRPRRAYQPNIQNASSQPQLENSKELKKSVTQQQEEISRKSGNGPNQTHSEDKESKRLGYPQTVTSGQQEESDTPKLKSYNNAKIPTQNMLDGETTKSGTESDKNSKLTKEQQTILKHDSVKVASNQNQNVITDHREDNGVKKTKQLTKSNKEQSQKSTENQSSNKKISSSRPAVILLDEATPDLLRNSESPSELIFGFEINEQLLLSDDCEETQEASSVFSTTPPLFDKPPPNFDRPPPMFEKHLRYDKPPPNFQMHPAHAQLHHHPIPHVVVPQLPYLSYGPPRFIPPPTYLPPPPPPGIMEKYQQQPMEDFLARYVAPEESVNILTYNHDKIVTFVGLAWEDVMREMPVTSSTGRVQYYSGQ
ncbi:uncharacterized protein LOC124178797 isoform X1 [Neodiprion fabricii]|uniref:uncharacterized protein LOC124178797 isoform X1 n=1 Tax=Neodiprion fabricii TaxID=2872261 RepID=UPI001ED8CC2D|nr:uncharacterized protein LOC124178797 isoform X1 [Neodiprion fabricii]